MNPDRRKIDVHVHIMPLYLVGKKDPAVNAEYLAYGKVVYSGQFTFRSMPDYIADSRFPVESLIEVMNNASVERAVIQQCESKRMAPEIISAVEAFPNRLKGAMTVKPGETDCIEKIKMQAKMGLSVIKLITAEAMGIPGAYSAYHFNEEPFLSVWKLAEELHLTVAVDPGNIGNAGYREKEWKQVARLFPDLHIVFCHMAFPAPDMSPEKQSIYDSVLETLSLKNVWMDVAAVQTLNREEVYPYSWTAETVRKVMNACGSDKLLWASDIPSTLVDTTYRQMIDIYERSPLFTEEEKDRLFYENACKAYRWNED